jgi:DNA-binding NarL/FixJ family response regulator
MYAIITLIDLYPFKRVKKIKIVAVTYCGDKYLYDNLTAFIDGYIKKPVDVGFIGGIIQRVSKGEKGYFDNRTRLEANEDIDFGRKLIWNDTQFTLTNQERNVLKCILSGMSNEIISKELYISISTVKFHVRNILRKCDASNKLELVKKYGLR